MLGRKKSVLLAVLPAIIFAIGAAMYAMRAPIYAGIGGYDYDPAYVYLLNGLSLLNGVAPNHIDHPGTPMQMLCAVLIATYWLLTTVVSWQPVAITDLVLSQPEPILRFISHALLGMNVVATYFLGRTIYRATGNWMAAALSQLSLPLLSISFFHTMYVNAEALAIFATLLLLAVLAHESLCAQEQGRLGMAAPIAAGSLVALAVTAKVTFLPLAVLVLSLRSWRRVWISLLACTVVGLILLAPVLHQLHRFFAWIGHISAHSGLYGTGEPSLVAWGELPSRFNTLAELFPVSAITLIALYTIGCLAIPHIPGSWRVDTWTDKRTAAFRLTQLIGVACLLQLAMVVKHFGLHYAIPTALLTATTIIFFGISLFAEKMKIYLASILAAVALTTAWHVYKDFVALHRAGRERAYDLAEMAGAIAQQERPLVVSTYRSRDRGYALQFGLGYVNKRLVWQWVGRESKHWSYNRWTRKFVVAGGALKEVSAVETLVQQGRTVLLLLPADVSIPGIHTETLVEIKNRERLLKVVGLQPD